VVISAQGSVGKLWGGCEQHAGTGRFGPGDV